MTSSCEHRSTRALAAPLVTIFIVAITPARAITQESAGAPSTSPADRDIGDDAPETYFQRAWHIETVEARLDEALRMYAGLAALAEVPDALRAKALFRSAVVLRKLQRRDEAIAAFSSIAERFPDVVEVVAAARREIDGETAAEAELRARAEGLIEKLRTASRFADGQGRQSPHGAARNELQELGPRVAPYVDAALFAEAAHPDRAYFADLLAFFAQSDSQAAALAQLRVRRGDPEARVLLIAHVPAGAPWHALLVEVLGDPVAEVRVAAAEALARQLTEGTIDSLRAVLADASAAVRAAALHALGESGDASVLADLRAAYTDAQPEVRAAAIEGVVQVARALEDRGPLDASAEIALLADPSREVLARVVTRLADLAASAATTTDSAAERLFGAGDAGHAALELLVRRAAELDGLTIEWWAIERPGSTTRPQEEPPNLHATALDVLRAAHDSRALPAFRRGLASLDRRVVRAAIRGIEDLEAREAVPDLIALLEQKPLEVSPPRRPGVPGRQAVPDPRDDAWRVLGSGLAGADTLELLASRLPQLRDHQGEVLQEIRRHGRRDLARAVLGRFASLDTNSRRYVVSIEFLSLANDRDGEAVVLAMALDDSDASVRVRALGTIAREVPSRELVPALLASYRSAARFSSAADSIRSGVVNALHAIDDERSLAVFIDALGAAEPWAKHAAVRFPPVLHGRSARPLLDLLADPRTRYPQAALDTLVSTARADDASAIAAALPELRAELRAPAIELLGRLANPSARASVERQLEDADPRVRAAAVTAFASLADETAITQLRAACADESPEVRVAALRVVRWLDAARSALSDSEKSVRVEATRALARVEDPAAVDLLITVLDDPSPFVATAAVESLAVHADLRATSAVLAMFARAAESGARAAGSGSGLDPSSSRGAQALEILLEYPPRLAITACRQTLDGDVPQSLRLGLIELLARIEDPEVLDLLLRELEHADAVIRRQAVAQCARLVDRRAIPALARKLRDPDDVVRQEARAAIEAIRFYEAQSRAASDGAGAGVDAALRELLVLLEDGAPTVRRAAVDALARAGDRAALPALVRARKDADASVREAIERALDALAEPAPRSTPGG